MRELLRIGGMCVHDLLEERFASAVAQRRARVRCGARHQLWPTLAGHGALAAVSGRGLGRCRYAVGAGRGPRCVIWGTGERRACCRRADPHPRCSRAHPGARRSGRGRRARVGARRSPAPPSSRAPTPRAPSLTWWAVSISMRASCAVCANCARAGSLPSCTWRSIGCPSSLASMRRPARPAAGRPVRRLHRARLQSH